MIESNSIEKLIIDNETLIQEVIVLKNIMNELESTSSHLISASWREQALKKRFEDTTEKIVRDVKILRLAMNELEETNYHLVSATWRERDLKAQLKKSNDNLHNEIEMMKIMMGELEQTNNNLISATWRERDLKKQLKEAMDEVTQSKQLIEVQKTRIEQSINYAQRIQNSILPKELVLKDVFSKSFILFKPKDVVSGDFPFIVKKDDCFYFAAVDCTGHGVPGALLSVIGSLLLHDLVKYEASSPAKILDKLHESVVKTLRQGEEGSENDRDGMDVGICCLNTITGVLQFAGAHRPLYIVRKSAAINDDLEELKGDKYPIGGVQYRGRRPFANFETKLNKGDRVYVCSDGYPDQFGGESEEPDKIGPKATRQILSKNNDKPIEEVKNKLVEYFTNWMGKQKQLDDVLFIGIEF